MRAVALTLSAILHIALIVLMIFGLPFSPPVEETETVVTMVDLVDAKVSDKTNAPPPPPTPTPRPKIETAPQPKPEPQKVADAPPPKPEPQPQPTPPPPAPPPAPAPPAPPPPAPPTPAPPPPKPVEPPPPADDATEPPPPPPKPEPPKPEPTPPTPPAPPTKPEPPKPETPPAPPAPPAPAAKPAPPKPAPPAKLDTGALAALLDKKIKSREQQAAASPNTQPSPPSPNTANTNYNASEPMSVSEIDAIRQQVARCWNFDPGVKDPGSLKVKIKVFLNQDGSLARPPQLVSTSRNDSYGQKAAESAIRAVNVCSPLKNLPPAKFERWRELEITFDPKDMLG